MPASDPEPDAAATAAQRRSAERPSPFPWPPVLLATLTGGAVLAHVVAPLPWPGLDDIAARAIGLGLGAAGLALMGWAGWTLMRANTTVLPHRGASALVTSGPFRRLRNPIYVADVLLMLGLAEATKIAWLIVAAGLFVPLITWLAIRPEERHLEARFGAAYREYKARSRRWI